ncbi:PAL-domain-containing protein [Hypoxylon rubiginosum]|uniref:PAL-domain-containing protein n=1 Tax=Hypoxylon rubiginosum TaxID=110542 RepID=A0ACB9YMB9_9PEZI|nr:PAL-domain-containing protein [Hypoxylon rubiginosum]
MVESYQTFSELLLAQQARLASSNSKVQVDSKTLTVADVVAVSRYLSKVVVTEDAVRAIKECSNIIKEKLAQGEIIYGVNTGFGGSADQRTNNVDLLQQRLLTLLMAGITSTEGSDRGVSNVSRTTCMPEAWVRASMLVRLNSLAAGASGVRLEITDRLSEMLNGDIVPLVPIRGSISASGDLGPLSYIGGVLQGKKYVSAFVGPKGQRELVRADVALAKANLPPLSVQAKEGLAIVNGTAVSAGVAALAAYECTNLAALTQVLTAMTVEALCGTDESFDPFIAQVRPHPGQIDSAQNMFRFLSGSRITNCDDYIKEKTLRQDRYSVRTASQWIGPILEDFQLAYAQISIELNSVTDNPLIDKKTSRILHGGNFQAKAITSAVEKLRSGLQSLGRILFSQCTELINPHTNRGLSPNLVADDPATSFLFKGTDIMVAALTSELGFLANPVGSHVQTAEMGNQGINSLALISARYTLKAVDTLSQLAAAHLVTVCQAIDLRVRLTSQDPTDLHPNAGPLLGMAARKVYEFVRGELKVPLITESLVSGDLEDGSGGVSPSVGQYNTAVYEAIRSGRLNDVVVQCVQAAQGGEVKIRSSL